MLIKAKILIVRVSTFNLLYKYFLLIYVINKDKFIFSFLLKTRFQWSNRKTAHCTVHNLIGYFLIVSYKDFAIENY